jgi:hypothetical protein
MWENYGGALNAENWEVVEHSGATEFRMAVGPNPNSGLEPWKTYYDKVFRLAAEHHITILAGLGTAQRYPGTKKEEEEFFIWTKEAVKRYGYNGDFWAENPTLPYKPVEAWEVWNEPNLAGENPIDSKAECEAIGQPYKPEESTCVQPERYGSFLVYISAAVQKASEEKAGIATQVLFGGLYLAPGGENYETFLLKAYKVPGLYSSYTGLSIHPYGFDPAHTQGDKTIAEVETEVTGVRNLLNSGRLPWGPSRSIWITELGWPLNSFGDSAHPAVKDQAEQARLLTQSFDWIKSQAATKNIRAVYWYNDRDIGINNWAYSCGLRDINGNFRQSWWAYLKETGASLWPFPAVEDDVAGPHPVALADGTVDAFFRTTEGKLGEDWYVPGIGWASTTLTGPALGSDPHVITQPGGGVDLFFRTTEGKLGEDWYVPGIGWASTTLTGPTLASDPHAVAFADGTVDLFFRTTEGKLGEDWYVPGIGWASTTLNGPALGSDPHVITQPGGGVDLFFRTPDGKLGEDWYVPGGTWASTTLTGPTLASDPHPVTFSDGTVDDFFRTPEGKLGEDWYVPGGTWASTTLTGPSLGSDPHPVAQPNGTVDVFFRTPGGELGHNWYVPGLGLFSGTQSGPTLHVLESPHVSTESATGITANSAQLNATINAVGSSTEYFFEYGPTSAYGSKAPAMGEPTGYGTSDVAIGASVSGLTGGSTYHYRIVAVSGAGTAKGSDRTFTTP